MDIMNIDDVNFGTLEALAYDEKLPHTLAEFWEAITELKRHNAILTRHVINLTQHVNFNSFEGLEIPDELFSGCVEINKE